MEWVVRRRGEGAMERARRGVRVYAACGNGTTCGRSPPLTGAPPAGTATEGPRERRGERVCVWLMLAPMDPSRFKRPRTGDKMMDFFKWEALVDFSKFCVDIVPIDEPFVASLARIARCGGQCAFEVLRSLRLVDRRFHTLVEQHFTVHLRAIDIVKSPKFTPIERILRGLKMQTRDLPPEELRRVRCNRFLALSSEKDLYITMLVGAR